MMSGTSTRPVAHFLRSMYTLAVIEGFACPSWSAAERRRETRLINQGGDCFTEVVTGTHRGRRKNTGCLSR